MGHRCNLAGASHLSDANRLNSLLCHDIVFRVVIRIKSKAHGCARPLGILPSERGWQPVWDLFIATHRRVQTLPGVSSAFAEGE